MTPNNRINSDWQFRYAPLPAGYAECVRFGGKDMTKVATVLSIVLILCGCATGELMSRMRPGMPKQEVVQVLGNPDGYQSRGEYEALKYSHRLVTGKIWENMGPLPIFS